MTKRLNLLTSLLVITLAACGGSTAPKPVAPEPDLLAVLKSRPSLTRFAEALETSGIAGTLLASGSYTIFAPVDRSVNEPLDEATIRHHILATAVTFSDMAGESTSYDTLNFDQIEIDVTEQIVVGTALMVESDIKAANGVIHVIDRVQLATRGPERLFDPQPIELTPQNQSAIPIPSDQTANTN